MATASSSANALQNSASPSARILLIDDEDFVRESLVAYLEDSGYECLQADDGESGLALFLAERPDLLVCDLRMPRMDGLSVLRKVRETSPDMPVIVVSGAGVISDVVQALRLGASDYLIKPIVDLEMLGHAVNRSLENARLREENRNYREALERANRELLRSLELLRVDQQAGREVQLNMLPPRTLTIGEYQFSYSITPSLYLSGDFVDYFMLSERHVLFYIADVSGHGASSAFITVLLKNLSYELMRRVAVDTDPEDLLPSRILKRINQVLLQVQLEKHLTAFVGVLDIRNHTLRHAVGGHFPYPIICDEDGCGYREMKGLPVGLFPDARFEDRMLRIDRRFSLTIFSDGVLEFLPDRELAAKEQQLLDVVRERGLAGADDIASALGVNDAPELPDDVTILTLRRGS